ncbi:MAG: hypothetical protein HC830_09980 [Bacteroidetes bacterium]|nr:hypothetical protein [Bacteroidales bacterium]NJO69555.1 hypothetical protein [Bacteroidota bacterium]
MKIYFIVTCLLLISIVIISQIIEQKENIFEKHFLSPPTPVLPYVWWLWMGSNFIWYYYRSDSPLKPAGLVGPVKLLNESVVRP